MEDTAEAEKKLTNNVHQEVLKDGHQVDSVEPTTKDTILDLGVLGEIGDAASSHIEEVARPVFGGTTVETDEGQGFLKVLKNRIRKKAA